MSITHFQKACQALIQQTVDALASSPFLTAAQRAVRAEAVVSAIMAFLPTEPIQVMLASQAVGHHLGAMDTFQQIFNRALADGISVKMRSISTGETRMMVMLVRELRLVRKEMIAVAEAEQQARPAYPIMAPAARPVTLPTARRATAPAAPAPAVKSEAPAPAAAPAVASPAVLPPTLAEVRRAAELAGDTEFAAHIADFENALAAVAESLEEARALDKPAAAASHLAPIATPGPEAAGQR